MKKKTSLQNCRPNKNYKTRVKININEKNFIPDWKSYGKGISPPLPGMHLKRDWIKKRPNEALLGTKSRASCSTFGLFPIKDMQTPPLIFDPVYMEDDRECAVWYEKNNKKPIRFLLQKEIILITYMSLIRSLSMYAAPIWFSNTSPSLIQKLQTLPSAEPPAALRWPLSITCTRKINASCPISCQSYPT